MYEAPCPDIYRHMANFVQFIPVRLYLTPLGNETLCQVMF